MTEREAFRSEDVFIMSDVHDMSILTLKGSISITIGRNVPQGVNDRGEKVWFTQLYE